VAHSFALALAAFLGVALLAEGGRAAEGQLCRLTETPGDPLPGSAWRSALDNLARELAAAGGTACNGVALTVTWVRDGGERDGARVGARTPDGLETSRFVASPGALSAVAFGLLAAAPVEAPPSDADPRDRPPPEVPAARHVPTPPADTLPHVFVSLAAGARAGFPTNVVMVDVELRADLLVHGWLVTLGMRATPLGASPRLADDPDGYAETAIALALGRELLVGRSAFDLSVGPNLTYIWMENDAANLSTEHAQLRLAALARWGYGVSRRVRLNMTIDGEIAPSGITHTDFEPGLAPFPAFTVGLRLGGEVAL